MAFINHNTEFANTIQQKYVPTAADYWYFKLYF